MEEIYKESSSNIFTVGRKGLTSVALCLLESDFEVAVLGAAKPWGKWHLREF